MNILTGLIIFPLFAAIGQLFFRRQSVLRYFIYASSLAIIAGSICLFIKYIHSQPLFFKFDFPVIDKLIFLIELFAAGYIFFAASRHKRYTVIFLIAIQTGLLAYFEFFLAKGIRPEHNLFLDHFSMLMSLVIGVIGGLIIIYAAGYMKDFHEDYHKELKDNRKPFFFLLFVFLSAMFGLTFSNNLIWLFFFWEITTVCSFILIGYKRSQEALDNSFLALKWNLLGGLAFFLGIIYLYKAAGTVELDKALALNKSIVLIPVVLISLAGLTKSAQLPFSGWLVGAMVAPTPVSALLHSSTMVKAGVYIILRFASVLEGTFAGLALALIGAITFLFSSAIAISQSDAKKVLAYSTIANLGLIVLCAGVGTYEAIWAGLLLIIFHALAKSLLFLCVGIAAHKIHSRNIDEMSGLIIKLPKLSIMLQVGMAGMFLAPFGMLISKWAVLRAIVNYNPILAMFVVFGSAITLFFWVKWLGRVIMVTEPHNDLESNIGLGQWLPLFSLSAFTIALCGLFPFIAGSLIEPYIIEIYGKSVVMSQGNNLIILIMLAMVMLFPLSFINYGKRVKVVDAYLGAANTGSSTEFRGSLGEVKNIQIKSYYLEKYFRENNLLKLGAIISLILVVIMLGAALL